MLRNALLPAVLVMSLFLAAAVHAAESAAITRPAPSTTQPAAGTATRPAPPVAAAPSVTPGAVDYYAMTADAFFKRPEVAQRLGQNTLDVTLLEAAVFQQTNRQRAEQKLPLFKHGMALNLMARRHSIEMASLQFFDHESPTPANATMADRLRNVGLQNVTAGENIAVEPVQTRGRGGFVVKDPIDGGETWYGVGGGSGQYSTYAELSAAIAAGWKASPGHWQNICNRQYVYLGVGIARGPYEDNKQDSIYATQNFCATATPAGETKAKAALSAANTGK